MRIGAHGFPTQGPARTRARGRRARLGGQRVPRRAVVLQAAIGVGSGRRCRARGLARCRRPNLTSGLPLAAVLARGLRVPAGGLLRAVPLHSRARALAGALRVTAVAWRRAAAQARNGMLRRVRRIRADGRDGAILGRLGRLPDRRPCGRAVAGRAVAGRAGRARRRVRVRVLSGCVRRGRAAGGLGVRVVLGGVRAVGRGRCGRVRAGRLGLRDQARDPLPRLGLRALADLHVVRRPGMHLRAGRVSRRLSRPERGEGQQVCRGLAGACVTRARSGEQAAATHGRRAWRPSP